MSSELAPFSEVNGETMPRFLEDMIEPLFDLIRNLPEEEQIEILGNHWDCALDAKADDPEFYSQATVELAMDGMLWNILINQPQIEDVAKDNVLMLFMEVAHMVWSIHPQPMPNTKDRQIQAREDEPCKCKRCVFDSHDGSDYCYEIARNIDEDGNYHDDEGNYRDGQNHEVIA